MLTANQQQVIDSYVRTMRLTGLKTSTQQLQSNMLKQFIRTVGKDFDVVSRNDIENFISDLIDRLKPSTVNLWKAELSKFWRWFGRPELMKGLKAKQITVIKKASDMLTEDEVQSIINACLNLRDKTIIAVLFDTAIRASELTNLDVGDVVNDGSSMVISVDGKTGIRTLGLISSAPLITQHLNEHPFKHQRKKPLFISLNHRNYLGRICVWTVENIVKLATKRAGIQKNVTPHIFRHSRLTQLANLGMNESTMRQWAGWSKDSTMPSVYLHISGADANETVRGLLLGEKPEKIRKPSKLLPIMCPRCKTANEATNEYCTQCWLPLKQKSVDKNVKMMELLKSEFLQLEGVDIEKMLHQYSRFKTETKSLEKFLDIFDSDSLTIEAVIDAMAMDDDALLELLGYLVGTEMISIDAGIISVKQRELQQMIQMQHRYIAER